MTVQQIADRLVELCRAGNNDQCYHELFTEDASSHEMPGLPDADTKGRTAMLAKSAKWTEEVAEMHEMQVADPVVYGDTFAVGMSMDMTKKDGTRDTGDEMCVYVVKDGKITSEHFIYAF